MDRHPSRSARALAVFALLVGIVAMHSAVFGTAHATDTHTAVVEPAAPADHTDCGDSGCGDHAAVHPCVFVLVALAIAGTLVLLYRLADTAAAARRGRRIWRGRRERPPPWTVLTLSQLAILRI
ncbi:DUF6153 family protein [Nocardia lasii]|uniref:DUF6153 family protein n=1 Tax=Nocardia lasii TaxID=1616107 RepID=A0ABW1JX60_9NOCA